MKQVTICLLWGLVYLMAAAIIYLPAGCDLLEQTVCDGVLLEDASAGELTEAMLALGLEDLGELFGDDD
jgi:hypothetical protein